MADYFGRISMQHLIKRAPLPVTADEGVFDEEFDWNVSASKSPSIPEVTSAEFTQTKMIRFPRHNGC